MAGFFAFHFAMKGKILLQIIETQITKMLD